MNWVDEALLDLVIFRAKYAEAVRASLLTDDDVWRRWLV